MKTLNDVVDAVFVINLASRTKRMQAIRNQLKQHGITFQRYNAIDGYSDVVKAEFEREKKRLGVRQRWGWKHHCHYACLRSHEEVWRIALEAGYERIAVFEDDVLLHRNFETLFDKTMGALHSKTWDVLYLGASVRMLRFRKNVNAAPHSIVIPHKQHLYGAFAYILNANSMRTLVQTIKTQGYVSSLDDWLLPSLYTSPTSTVRCFLTGTPLCITDVRTSDLRRSRDQDKVAIQFGWNLKHYHACHSE